MRLYAVTYLLMLVVQLNGIASEIAPSLDFKTPKLEKDWNAWPESVRQAFAKLLHKAVVLSLKEEKGGYYATFPLGVPAARRGYYEIEASNEFNKRCKLTFIPKSTGIDSTDEIRYEDFKQPLKELPSSILEAANKLKPKTVWDDLARVEGSNINPLYWFRGKLDGKTIKLALLEDGTIPSHLTECLQAAEIPKKIRAIAEKEFPGFAITGAERHKYVTGDWFYVIEGTLKNEIVKTSIDNDGKILKTASQQ